MLQAEKLRVSNLALEARLSEVQRPASSPRLTLPLSSPSLVPPALPLPLLSPPLQFFPTPFYFPPACFLTSFDEPFPSCSGAEALRAILPPLASLPETPCSSGCKQLTAVDDKEMERLYAVIAELRSSLAKASAEAKEKAAKTKTQAVELLKVLHPRPEDSCPPAPPLSPPLPLQNLSPSSLPLPKPLVLLPGSAVCLASPPRVPTAPFRKASAPRPSAFLAPCSLRLHVPLCWNLNLLQMCVQGFESLPLWRVSCSSSPLCPLSPNHDGRASLPHPLLSQSWGVSAPHPLPSPQGPSRLPPPSEKDRAGD